MTHIFVSYLISVPQKIQRFEQTEELHRLSDGWQNKQTLPILSSIELERQPIHRSGCTISQLQSMRMRGWND